MKRDITPNRRLKLTRLTRSFWKRPRNFPKFAPALQQWEAGQLSRQALGQVSVMHETISRTIPGAEELANWFGGWPSFHDAEIVDLDLQRAGRSRIRIHTWQMTNEVGLDGSYVTDHHVVVSFWFEDISGLALTGFNLQNVIAGLDVEKTASGYRISLEPCYGLAGDIEAGSIRVSFEPGSPQELGGDSPAEA